MGRMGGTMPIFDVRNETLSRDLLNQLQLERLQAALNRAQRNVAWYRDAMAEAGVSVEDVRALDDLRRLPMMTGETLVRAYPYGLFAVPLREIIRLHSVMGPAGETVVTGYTRNDVSQWTRLAARTLAAKSSTKTARRASVTPSLSRASSKMRGSGLRIPTSLESMIAWQMSSIGTDFVQLSRNSLALFVTMAV